MIYLLKVDLENACEYVLSDPDLAFDDYYDAFFSGKPLPDDWVLPKHFLGNKKKQLRDFVYGENRAPYVSARAKEVLEQLPNADFEMRSIGMIRSEPFYVLNITRVIPCLDTSRSKIQYADDESENPSRICTIWDYEFLEERLPGQVCAFKVPEDYGRIFVTSVFVEAVKNAGLSGITFERPNDIGIVGPNHAVSGLPIR